MADKQNEKALCYYRIKTEWTAEGERGDLSKIKSEELVLASSYTDAEKVAYSIAEDQNRAQFGSINIEIIKTKIGNVLFNDVLAQDEEMTCGLICNFFEEGEESGVGLYAVKVMFIVLDEKSGKEKRSVDTIYVPAVSNADATQKIDEYLGTSMSDYVIRDVKFDKAEAIYWPSETHQQKVKSAEIG